MRTASQIGRWKRSKGHAWEREVAAIFAPLFPGRDVRRNIAQSRTASREGCDVEGTDWWIECKVGARIDLRGALDQAERDAGEDHRYELVVAKQDRKRPVVCFRLGALLATTGPHCMSVVTMDLAEFVYAETRARGLT